MACRARSSGGSERDGAARRSVRVHGFAAVMVLAHLLVALLPATVMADERPARQWLVAVGVDRYPALEPPELRAQFELRYAVRDAEHVAELLERDYGFEIAAKLLDERATRQNILESLHRLADSQLVGPEDSVVFYFSGHALTAALPGGGHEGFLVPYDGAIEVQAPTEPVNLGQVAPAGVSMTELRHAARRIPARHVLLLLDCCFSGLVAGERAIAVAPRVNDPPAGARAAREAAAQMYPDRAERVLVAGTGEQVVLEHPRWEHGAFTRVLLEALGPQRDALVSANDGLITASALARYVQVEVPRLVRDTPGLDGFEQTPQHARLHGTRGEFVFIPPGWEPTGRPAPEREVARAQLPCEELEVSGRSQAAGTERGGDPRMRAIQAALRQAVGTVAPTDVTREELDALFADPRLRVIRDWHVLDQHERDGELEVRLSVCVDAHARSMLRHVHERRRVDEADLAEVYRLMGRPRVLVNLEHRIDRIDSNADVRHVQRRIERRLIDLGLDVFSLEQLERLGAAVRDDDLRRRQLAERGVQLEIGGSLWCSHRGEMRIDPDLPPMHDYTTVIEVVPVHTPTGRILRPQTFDNRGQRERPLAAFSELEAALNSIDDVLDRHFDEIFRTLARDWMTHAQRRTVTVRLDDADRRLERQVIDQLLVDHDWLVTDVPTARVQRLGDTATFDVIIQGEQGELEQLLDTMLVDHQLEERTDGRLGYALAGN